MVCKICKRKISQLRGGVCFDCVGFESLIKDKVDMWDKPVKKEIKGTESINILFQILKNYRLVNNTYQF